MSDVSCPRCGYAFGGLIASWTEQCPMHGACSECGLDFAWSDVFTGAASAPTWFVETQAMRPRAPKRWLGTMLRSTAPWLIWSRVRMEHEPRRLRLLVYLFVVVLMTYVSFAGAHGVNAWRATAGMPRAWNAQRQVVPVTTLNRVTTGLASFALPFWSGTSAPASIDILLIPRDLLSHYRSVIEHHLGWEAYDLVLLSTQSERVLFGSVLTIAAVLLCPFCSAVLAITFRRAAVRPIHILRIAGYSSVVLPSAVFAFTLTLGHSVRWSVDDAPWPASLITIIMPIWLVVWWWLALRQYLRIRHALAAGVAIVLLAYLFPLTAAGLLVAVTL